jgi:hypothetical protein
MNWPDDIPEAVRAYREHRLFRLGGTEHLPPDDEVNGDVADAAIAALRAELERVTTFTAVCVEAGTANLSRAERAEAEVEQLKGFIALLERADIRIVSSGGSFTLREFRDGLADLAARYEEEQRE